MIVYAEKLKVSLGIKLFWGLVALTFFLFGVLLCLSKSFTVCLLCWVLGVAIVIVALAFTPKKFILSEDKIEIKLWFGHTLTIPAHNIKAVEKLAKPFVFLSQDIPFKSSWSIPVRVVRKKGVAFVVTPVNPDKFASSVAQIMTNSGPDFSGQPAAVK